MFSDDDFQGYVTLAFQLLAVTCKQQNFVNTTDTFSNGDCSLTGLNDATSQQVEREKQCNDTMLV